jgi:hypothetical protein
VDDEPPPPPLLDEAALFRQHYDRSVQLYNFHDYGSAIVEMKAAYGLKPIPRLMFNLGQAYRKQDMLDEAIDAFGRYLSVDGGLPPAVRGEVEAYQSELRAKKAARDQARLAPKVVYVQLEKPIPKWFRPVGITGVVVGLGLVGVGASFLGINGHCSDPVVAPALVCDRLYNTLVPGASLLGVGGGLAIVGTVLFGLSYRRPQSKVVTRPQLPVETPLTVE